MPPDDSGSCSTCTVEGAASGKSAGHDKGPGKSAQSYAAASWWPAPHPRRAAPPASHVRSKGSEFDGALPTVQPVHVDTSEQAVAISFVEYQLNLAYSRMRQHH
jgi:hypothetical protein